MFSYDKCEVSDTSTHSQVPIRDSKEVKPNQIDLNVYNLLYKARSTMQETRSITKILIKITINSTILAN